MLQSHIPLLHSSFPLFLTYLIPLFLPLFFIPSFLHSFIRSVFDSILHFVHSFTLHTHILCCSFLNSTVFMFPLVCSCIGWALLSRLFMELIMHSFVTTSGPKENASPAVHMEIEIWRILPVSRFHDCNMFATCKKKWTFGTLRKMFFIILHAAMVFIALVVIMIMILFIIYWWPVQHASLVHSLLFVRAFCILGLPLNCETCPRSDIGKKTCTKDFMDLRPSQSVQ